jgi:hypothetical protein
MSPGLRSEVERVAELSDRSLSQTVEQSVRQGIATYELLWRTPGVLHALAAMSRFAAQVLERIGDPSATGTGRAALIAGWRSLAESALPFSSSGDAEIDLGLKRDVAIRACAALDERIKDQIAEALGDPVGGRRIDDDFEPVRDVRPAPAVDLGPVIQAYVTKSVRNSAAAPDAVEKTSVDALIGRLRYGSSKITLPILDDLLAGLSAIKEVGEIVAPDIDACLETLSSYREAFVAYEKAVTEAASKGERLAAAIARPIAV